MIPCWVDGSVYRLSAKEIRYAFRNGAFRVRPFREIADTVGLCTDGHGEEEIKPVPSNYHPSGPEYCFRDHYTECVMRIYHGGGQNSTSHLSRLPVEIIAHIARFTHMIPSPSLEHREEYLLYAALAEQCQRWEDVAEAMMLVARMDQPLNKEQRGLLAAGFKNTAGALRLVYRLARQDLEKEEQQEAGDASYKSTRKALLRKTLHIQGNAVNALSSRVLQLVRALKPESLEAGVFFMKMQADYHRYCAELDVRDDAQYYVTQATELYDKASAMAEAALDPLDCTRLAVALNRAVHYYEILRKGMKAMEICQKAFDDGIAGLDRLTDEPHTCTLILQLLRDNLTLWKEDAERERED